MKYALPHSQKGFTLIELLVVIAIIGILSAVVLASLNSARLKSRDTRRIADLKQLQNALALYFDTNQLYPTSLTPLQTQGFIAMVPSDPNGSAYFYAALGTGSSCRNYHLGAILEDSTNQSLLSDAAATAGGVCLGSNADFAGESAACTTTVGADRCYDQKP